jgi:hypothetical protein
MEDFRYHYCLSVKQVNILKLIVSVKEDLIKTCMANQKSILRKEEKDKKGKNVRVLNCWTCARF